MAEAMHDKKKAALEIVTGEVAVQQEKLARFRELAAADVVRAMVANGEEAMVSHYLADELGELAKYLSREGMTVEEVTEQVEYEMAKVVNNLVGRGLRFRSNGPWGQTSANAFRNAYELAKCDGMRAMHSILRDVAASLRASKAGS